MTLTVVDSPKVVELPQPVRVRLEFPLRVLLAFMIALGLAVLWHAIDPRLYGPGEAEDAAEAPLLGAVPRR